MSGAAPEPGKPFRPAPDPAVALPNDSLGGHLELYAGQASQLDPLSVWVDVIRADTAAVVRTQRAQIGTTQHEGRRVAQVLIRSAGLQPGHYVARAKLLADDREFALVARPFRVMAPD